MRQQITDAKWKRGKYIVKGIDDFGDKYEHDWAKWQPEADVKYALGKDGRLLKPHRKAWEIAGCSQPLSRT